MGSREIDAAGPLGSASRAVLVLGFAVGLASFAHYWSRNLTTAHYDAKAHLVLARSIIDSTRPGYAQLGAHWLPLPHLVFLPLVAADFQYRTGLLPSLLSVTAFALSGWLVFRITTRFAGSPRSGIFAAVVLLANANLQYIQSAPLTEPLYMLLLLCGVESLSAWREKAVRGIPWIPALWASLGAFCRYEGWYFLAGVILILLWDCKSGYLSPGVTLKAVALFLGLFLLPVAAHFSYIHAQIGDTFIERVIRGNTTPYETFRRPFLSALYHLGELTQMAGILPLIAGFSGVVYCLSRVRPMRRWLPLLLLWLPSLMNISALYWGLIYRVRYSSLLLPAVAVFSGLALLSPALVRRFLVVACLLVMLLPWLSWYFPGTWEYRFFSPGPGIIILPAAAICSFLIGCARGSYQWPLLAMLAAGVQIPALHGEDRPIIEETLEHGFIEPERRAILEQLQKEYDGSRILIDLGKLAPLVYDSQLPVREFVYREGDRALWSKAVRDPRSVVGWLCVEKGDEIWEALQVDPRWADRYSLAVQTRQFYLYRLRPEFREALLPGRRHE